MYKKYKNFFVTFRNVSADDLDKITVDLAVFKKYIIRYKLKKVQRYM